MTDWQAVADALKAPVAPQDRTAITALETLERNFRPLHEKIDFAAPLWSSPSDVE